MKPVTAVRRWWSSKHEPPWDLAELGRLKSEVKASWRRNRRRRAAVRRRLPSGDVS